MKRFLALLAGVLVLAAGCTTFDKGPLTPEQQAQKIERISIVVKNSARDAIVYGNAKDPVATQKAALAALKALDGILGEGDQPDVNPSKIRQVLVDAGLTKLGSPEAILVISGLTTTYELFYADVIAGKIGEHQDVVDVVKALRDGVKQGLESVVVPPELPPTPSAE